MRHTSFSFALQLSANEEVKLRRHAGASRFAYNQCLRLCKNALEARKQDPTSKVPRSGFDLINAFNAWKVSPAAGVDEDGKPGLPWRQEILAQVFEEAAVDFSRGLQAFFSARQTASKRRVGFPRSKKKGRSKDSFRMRNSNGGVRVALHSIRLPKIGELQVCESTRRLRRLLRLGPDGKPRAKILFATVSLSGGRWHVRINVEAPEFHAGMQVQKNIAAPVAPIQSYKKRFTQSHSEAHQAFSVACKDKQHQAGFCAQTLYACGQDSQPYRTRRFAHRRHDEKPLFGTEHRRQRMGHVFPTNWLQSCVVRMSGEHG